MQSERHTDAYATCMVRIYAVRAGGAV